jgi:ABC-2 type transport system ATP-binding protein
MTDSDMTLALNIKGLNKTYDNGFVALKNIDLAVKAGDFFAMLGPNGAGKSTTLGIVSSLVNKTSGAVSVFGHDLDTDRMAVKGLLGVVPQEFNFNAFEKVYDIILQQAGYYGMPAPLAKTRIEHYLKKLDLWEKRHVQARMLSGGMKRRLMIARALIHEPKLLILDEPTAGVDIELRRTMWEFLEDINAMGTTIILTTHYLEEAEALCRNIAIINKGEIVANTSAHDLLRQLKKATFVADLVNPISIPENTPYNFRIVGDAQVEFDVIKDQPLNPVIALLGSLQGEVLSIRPKHNRLEEVFVDLIHGDNT